jgi:hypothetical protein
MDKTGSKPKSDRKALTLNPRSKWLLLYLDTRHPLGVGSVVPLPYPDDLPGGKIGMSVLRGLIRRGLAYEAVLGHPLGIFYITEEGHKVASLIRDSAQAGKKEPERCWLCSGAEPDTTIVVECDVPSGKVTEPHNVRVHFGCYMDMDP